MLLRRMIAIRDFKGWIVALCRAIHYTNESKVLNELQLVVVAADELPLTWSPPLKL